MHKPETAYNERIAKVSFRSEPMMTKVLARMMLPLALIIMSVTSVTFLLSLDTILG